MAVVILEYRSQLDPAGMLDRLKSGLGLALAVSLSLSKGTGILVPMWRVPPVELVRDSYVSTI